jgi:transcriptional antiterminator RfaH
MLRWYLIHTKPSSEVVAQTNLTRQGYEVYLPRAAQPARWRGEWRERIVALFPRYLFLRLNEGFQALSPIHSTSGVAGVVRFGAHYTIVPDHVIRDLQQAADPESGLHRLCVRKLRPGALVRIASGPLDGLEGIFDRRAGADRVVVLLKVLGQNASVCVPVRSIQLNYAA